MIATPVRVLLVDDDRRYHLLIGEYLTHSPIPIELHAVASYEQAVTALSTDTFDVCLIDYDLGLRNGIELLEEIRDSPFRTPMIMLTGHDDEGIEARASRAGAVDYIEKQGLTSKLLVRAIRYAVERNRMVEQIRRSEEHFRLLIENAQDVITVLAPDGTISYESPSVERVLGYKPSERIGTSAFDRVHPDDLPRIIETFENGVRSPGSLVTIIYRYRHREGGWRYLESIGTSRVDDPLVGGVVINSRDITERQQIEEALRESQERFHVALKNSPVVVFNHDRDLRYTWVHNPRAIMRNEDVTGLTDADLTTPESAAELMAIKRQVMESGIGIREDVCVVYKGERWHYDLTMEPLRDQSGEIVGITCAAVDVTEHRKAEEALSASRQLFERFMDNSPSLTYMKDEEGRYIYVNKRFTDVVGLAAEAVLGRTDHDLLPPDLAEQCVQGDAQVRAVGRAVETRESATIDGTEYHWLTMKFPFADAEGRKLLAGKSYDITDRIRAERLLAESEVMNRAILDSLAAHIAVLDSNGTIIAVNEAWERFGRENGGSTLQGSHIGANYLEICRRAEQTAGASEAHRGIQAVIDQTLLEFTLEYHCPTPGDFRWFLLSATALRNRGGAVVSHMDITQRKLVEESLRKSEERFQLATLATNDAIYDWDFTTNGVWWNVSLQTLFRYTPEEIEHTFGWWERQVHPDDLNRIRAGLETVVGRRQQIWVDEYRFRRGDGTWAYVFDRGYLIYDESGRPIRLIGAMTDLTARKEMEDALRESELRYRRIVETAQEGIWVMGNDGVIRFANARISEMLGYPIERIVGSHYFDFIEPGMRADALAKFRRRQRGIAEHYDFEFIRQDGTPLWAIVAANPVFDRNGQFAESLAMITDITKRKRAEEALKEANDTLEARVLERTAEIVQMMQRLEQAHTIQKRFVADASHDLRTPLTVVRAELELLLEHGSLDAQTRAVLEKITGQSRRLADLTSDLLMLATLDARHAIDPSDVVRLDELLLECIAQLSALSEEKRISWNIRFDDPVEIRCDAAALARAVTNVLENALKYSSAESVVSVTLSNGSETARLTVEDSGVGIQEQDLPRVFDRFYRGDLTRTTPGTGLGLAIVKAVVEAHNGEVEIVSAPGSGTAVRITLPSYPNGAD